MKNEKTTATINPVIIDMEKLPTEYPSKSITDVLLKRRAGNSTQYVSLLSSFQIFSDTTSDLLRTYPRKITKKIGATIYIRLIIIVP